MSGPIYLKIPGTDLYRHEGDCINGRFVRPTRPSPLRTHAQWVAATPPPSAPAPGTPSPQRRQDWARFLDDIPYMLQRRHAQRQAAADQPPAAQDLQRLVVEKQRGDMRVNRPGGPLAAVPVPRPPQAAPRVPAEQQTVPPPPDMTRLVIEKQRGDHRINGTR